MKVIHTVEAEVIHYYTLTVEDDTDHPMTDAEIAQKARDAILSGEADDLTETERGWLEERDIGRVVPVCTEDAETGEDITDEFIDIQRKAIKEG